MIPKPLSPGGRVALVAPASAVPAEKLQPALGFVRSLGLEPVPYPSCFFANRDGYLSAPDDDRAVDLTRAFADPSIDGIWCIRGGYGSHRILPMLPVDLIRCHPKWFGGYSDVTALHTFLNQTCGLETFHCVMPSTEPSPDAFTLSQLRRALFGPLEGTLPMPEGVHPKTLVPGRAAGPLCGGNLSLIAASLGTPWELDATDKVLFLEDIGEKTYRVDAMLTQLRNAGMFDLCAGVVLGAWTDCLPEDPDRTLSLTEIFRQLIVPAGKPLVMDFPCGHTQPTLALPMGRPCILDAGAGTLTLEAME